MATDMPGEFEKNVRLCGLLAAHYCPGLQALRSADKQHIIVMDPRQLTGSLDVDSALATSLPFDSRWDYGIGHKPGKTETVHWIEIHPATDREAKVVQAKLVWLKSWMKTNAVALSAMQSRYIWVSSGKTALTPLAPVRRRLAQQGLLIAGALYRIT